MIMKRFGAWINKDFKDWTIIPPSKWNRNGDHSDSLRSLNPPCETMGIALATGHIRVRSKAQRKHLVIETTSFDRLLKAIKFLDKKIELKEYSNIDCDLWTSTSKTNSNKIVQSLWICPRTLKISKYPHIGMK